MSGWQSVGSEPCAHNEPVRPRPHCACEVNLLDSERTGDIRGAHLNLVEDEKRADFVAPPAQCPQEVLVRLQDATLALRRKEVSGRQLVRRLGRGSAPEWARE